MAAGMHPLIRAAFHLDEAGANLLTATARVYMLTLCGYAIQEIAARALYARKEALIPLATIVVRLVVYLAIGISTLLFFESIGAPAIAFAEISLTVEAVVMLIILSRRMKEPIKIDGSLLKGLVCRFVWRRRGLRSGRDASGRSGDYRHPWNDRRHDHRADYRQQGSPLILEVRKG